MKAIVTVIGQDTIGIIARTSTILAAAAVNILDISQTIMGGFFTMTMLVDLSAALEPQQAIAEKLSQLGREMGLEIRMQHEDIFHSMHRI